MYGPEGIMVSCGGNERLNTVPFPELPPCFEVPYRVLPYKVNSANGLAPSLPPIKVCRLVKPVPSVLIANTVPLPELPPKDAVPYKALPTKIRPAIGCAPSLFVPSEPEVVVKLYRFVNPVPSVLREKMVPKPELPP